MPSATSSGARAGARRPGSRLRWLAAAFALVASACDASPTAMRPYHRFSAPAGDPLATGIPVATLDDETRPVLRAPPLRIVAWSERAPVAGDGAVEVSQILRDRLARAPHLVVRAHLAAGRERHVTPATLVPIRRSPAGRLFRARFPVPSGWQASEVSVTVRGIPIGTEELGSIATEEVEIPTGARLEFGIGVLEPELGSDPVAFRIEVCADACETIYRAELAPARPEDRGWRDARVALDAWAGSRRRFAFHAERLADAAPFTLPLWASPTIYAPDPQARAASRRRAKAGPPEGPARPAGSPNLILLSVDTLRADHLPSYGYSHPTAPFLDSLARSGTLFENCLAASTATTPSHMTMFTSLPPSAHGATDGFKTLSDEIKTLPEWIRGHGIDTAAITENGFVGVQHGFARGFDLFVENKSARIMAPEGQVDRTFARARRWLELHRDKRFFLFLHTYQVHAPYSPPERYSGLFATQDGRIADASAPLHLRQRADYDREIRYTDDELARLYAAILELGLAERTILVVTSDHGEEFLEHGLVSHGGHLYQESVAVPLVVHGPGIPAGRRVAAPVGHADLMPTVLELLGLPVPEGLAGRSLGGWLAEPVEELPARPLFSESWATFQPGGPSWGRNFEPPSLAVRRGGRKLARYRSPEGTRYELYDLASDPAERIDLFADAPEDARSLSSLLEAYEREHVRAGSRDAPPGEAPAILDADREEKLRALGYVE